MRSFSQQEIIFPNKQCYENPFQGIPSQSIPQNGSWHNFLINQEAEQQKFFQNEKNEENERRRKYREILEANVNENKIKKSEFQEQNRDLRREINQQENYLNEAIQRHKIDQKIIEQKLREENLELANQRAQQANTKEKNNSFETMDQLLNRFRTSDVNAYRKNQNKILQEFNQIQRMNSQQHLSFEPNKMIPKFPRQDISKNQDSHNSLTLERKNMHDYCDEVVYEQIKLKEAIKQKEIQDKEKERKRVDEKAMQLAEQFEREKQSKKNQYQFYSNQNDNQAQFKKQLDLRESQMNLRESNLNSNQVKSILTQTNLQHFCEIMKFTRDKFGNAIKPYSFAYSSHERRRQLNMVDNVMNRVQTITPSTETQKSRNSRISQISSQFEGQQYKDTLVQSIQTQNNQFEFPIVYNSSAILPRTGQNSFATKQQLKNGMALPFERKYRNQMNSSLLFNHGYDILNQNVGFISDSNL